MTTVAVKNYNFKEGVTKAALLLWFQAVLIMLLILLRPVYGFEKINLLYLLKILATGFFFRFYFQTLRNLNYTFWTLTIFQSIYVFNDLVYMLQFDGGEIFVNINIVILIMAGALAYIMSSPIYFPRIQWWEYDFRYRGDLKILAVVGENEYAGRLTDLRREAGCITLYEDLKVSEEIKIRSVFNNEEVIFDCMVVSKRESSPGRGITYGVKFLLIGKRERRFFSDFCDDWAENKRVKIREKFTEN